MVIPKLSYEWDGLDKKKVQLNTRAIYYLHYAIDRNEYNCVFHCEFANDIYIMKNNS